MAVDHFPEHTISRHRFSRSGDLWKHVLPLLRRVPTASDIFDLTGIQLEWQAGAYRVPIPCPHCGAVTLTRDDAYAVVYRGGGVYDYSGEQNQPDKMPCRACNRPVDPLHLLEGWKAKDLDRLLTDGPLRRYAPKPKTFIVASLDGKFPIGRTIKKALDPVLGPVFELTQRLSRIEATSREHVGALVAQHHASMTWKDVALRRDLEPVDIGWHGGPLAEWERRKLEGRKHAKVIQVQKDLDRELQEFRRKREAELGL